MSNPLPETYQPGASAFWMKMEPQPEQLMSEGIFRVDEVSKPLTWTYGYESWVPPYIVGETLYLQEEWRCCSHSYTYQGKSLIEYIDEDGEKLGKVKTEYEVTADEFKQSLSGYRGIWQPAHTMPSWAARQRFTVASVEAKRPQDLKFSQRHFMKLFPNPNHYTSTLSAWDAKFGQGCWNNNDWGWYVTLEDVT